MSRRNMRGFPWGKEFLVWDAFTREVSGGGTPALPRAGGVAKVFDSRFFLDSSGEGSNIGEGSGR